MGRKTDIAEAAELGIGDSDVLGAIQKGIRLNERVEIRVSGEIPKKCAVSRYEFTHDLDTLLWCGPCAVSCLTGASSGEVRDIIREFRDDDTSWVQGTLDEEIEYAFAQLGYTCRLVYFCHAPLYKEAPTMARWLREFPRQPHIGYVMGQRGHGAKAGHWCTVLGDSYCCPLTNGMWVPLEKAPGRRQRMQSAYAILKN